MKQRMASSKHKLKSNNIAYLFILPNILIFVVFSLIPMLGTVVFSFLNFNVMFTKVEFVGGEQFLKLLNDSRFWNAMWNTVFYTLLSVFGQMIVSLFLAELIKANTKLNVLFRTAYFLPVVCSMTIVSIVWKMLLNPDIGAVGYFIRQIGLDWTLLKDPNQAMLCVILISVWKNFGYVMVIFIAALQNVPDVYYESASLDGVNAIPRFFKITVPLVMPTISFVLVTNIISSFQVFDSVFVLTGGGPMHRTETLVTYIYQKAFKSMDMGAASAMAMLMFIVILALSLVSFFATNRDNTK